MPQEENKTEEKEFLPKQEPQVRTRGWWIKTALLLILVTVSIVMLFTLGDYLAGEETLTFSELLHSMNYPLLGVLLGVVLLYLFVESAKYSYMLKVYTGKFHFPTSVKTMFIGKYYDGITPFNTGGQPFQIYYLHKKKDVPHGAATAIPVLRYIMNVFVLSAISAVMLFIAPRYLDSSTLTLTVLIISWISFAVNLAMPITVILFSIFPKACKKIIAALVRLLAKLHLVKHRYKTTEKYVRELTEYSQTLQQVGRQIYKFIPLILLSAMESVLYMTTPFFVVIAIANVTPSLALAMQIACLVIITRYTALLVPTPGNTGAAEAASSLVFVTVAGIGSVIGWVILTWRFIIYYVYLLTGIGINIFELIRGSIRSKKVKSMK